MSSDMSSVVVVYGALRSGTTMLRLMLDGNPALTCPGESDYLFDFVEIDGAGNMTLDLDALRRDRIFQATGKTIEDQGSVKATLDHLMAQQARDGTLVLMLHRGIEKLRRIYPEMKIIHMLRDPRDVARSGIALGWAGNVYYGINHWIATETEWDRAAPGTASGQVFDLPYEFLVSEPENTLQALCRFLDIAWTAGMLAYDGSSTYERPDPRLLEQWKRKLSPREVGLVEARIGGMLTARGYSPSAHPAVIPGLGLALHLNLQNRAHVWRHRITRYGLRDTLLVALARRTGLRGLGHSAQARINEKHVKYLK